MTEERLARRYRALLRVYPRWYREERGAELVGTLLDCARPGQARPTWRETRALVLEGLRVRAGAAGHRNVGATLFDAARVAVLMALGMWTIDAVVQVVQVLQVGRVGASGWMVGLASAVGVLGVGPFLLVARGRYRLAMPLLAAGLPAGAALSPLLQLLAADPAPVADPHLAMFSAVALAGTSVLWQRAPGRARAGSGMLTWAVVPSVLYAVPALLPADPAVLFWFGRVLPFVVMYVGALAYAAVDPRPALAAATFLVLDAVRTVVILGAVDALPTGPIGGVLAGGLVAAVVAVAAAGLGVRRQVAALPTKGEG